MIRVRSSLLVLVFVLGATFVAQAQAFGGLIDLLRIEQVKKELKLNDEALAKVEKLREKIQGEITLAATTSVDAQEKRSQSWLTIDEVERNKLLHINASNGIFEIAVATTLPKAVNQSRRRALDDIVRDLKAGRTKEANRKWLRFVSDLSTGRVSVDIHATLNWLLRQAYVESNNDLQSYAEKVKYFNEQKKAIRDYIAEIRDYKSSLLDEFRTIEIEREYVRNGKPFRYGKKKIPKSDLDHYKEEVEEYYATASGSERAANKDLLRVLQKDQRAYQLMSTVSRSLHDSMMTVLSKAG